MASAEASEYPTMKHFLLQGGVLTHASSSMYTRSRASAQCWNSFSCQNAEHTGLDKFWSQQILRYSSNFLLKSTQPVKIIRTWIFLVAKFFAVPFKGIYVFASQETSCILNQVPKPHTQTTCSSSDPQP